MHKNAGILNSALGMYLPGLNPKSFGFTALGSMLIGGDNFNLIGNSFSAPSMLKGQGTSNMTLHNELATNLNKTAERKPKMIKVSSADLAFVDSLISGLNTTEKTAANKGGLLGDFLNSEGLRDIMPALGAMSIGAVGLNAGAALYDKAKDAVKKSMSYKEMFEEFPELNDMPRTQVDKYWNVLNDFAPKLTTNPLVAGQFISNMASYGMRGIDHNVIGQLAKIEGDLRNSSGFSDALGTINSMSSKMVPNIMDDMTSIDPASAGANTSNF